MGIAPRHMHRHHSHQHAAILACLMLASLAAICTGVEKGVRRGGRVAPGAVVRLDELPSTMLDDKSYVDMTALGGPAIGISNWLFQV